jgi:BON domain
LLTPGVLLSGSVHNEQQKAAAEEIARHFPGVRSVTNTLVANPKEEMMHAMSSAEGVKAKTSFQGNISGIRNNRDKCQVSQRFR